MELSNKTRDQLQFATLIIGIIIILGIIALAVYMFINVQEIKLLNSNVCDLCESWTGGNCIPSGSLGLENNLGGITWDFGNLS